MLWAPPLFAGRPLRQIGKQLGLPASTRHGVEDQTSGDREKRHHHQPHRQDRGRQPRHQAGFQIRKQDRDREADRDQRQRDAERGEKTQRALGAIEPKDREQDAEAVAPGVEL
jgi:hypothetical protein